MLPWKHQLIKLHEKHTNYKGQHFKVFYLNFSRIPIPFDSDQSASV